MFVFRGSVHQRFKAAFRFDVSKAASTWSARSPTERRREVRRAVESLRTARDWRGGSLVSAASVGMMARLPCDNQSCSPRQNHALVCLVARQTKPEEMFQGAHLSFRAESKGLGVPIIDEELSIEELAESWRLSSCSASRATVRTRQRVAASHARVRVARVLRQRVRTAPATQEVGECARSSWRCAQSRRSRSQTTALPATTQPRRHQQPMPLTHLPCQTEPQINTFESSHTSSAHGSHASSLLASS